MRPQHPSSPPDELRIPLLNAEITFLEAEWSSLGRLNHLIHEFADHKLAPESNAALAQQPPQLEGRSLVMTTDLPARQFVAGLLELRPGLMEYVPPGERPRADPPYDPMPIRPLIAKIRGRERQDEAPNVAGFYRVHHRPGGVITRFGVVEVNVQPDATLLCRRRTDEPWVPLSRLDLASPFWNGPYETEAEAEATTHSRP